MKKYYGLFGFFCCLVYFTSYISRINFGAVVAEIVAAEGIAKSAVSIVVLMGFISYGAGQVISGALGDKFLPGKLMTYGFLLTGICNIAMPFCGSIAAMSAVWFVNGFAQSMMWPPLVKLMNTYLEDEQFSRTAANVSAASSVGTIFVYLTAPMFIRAESWRSVFYFSGSAALVMALLMAAVLPKITAKLTPVKAVIKEQTAKKSGGIGQILREYGFVFIFIAIVAQGIIRDGLTTWMPSCLSEVFNMEASSSIFVSVILPIFSIFSFKLFSIVQQKWVKNEVLLSVQLFAVCTVLIVIWGALYSSSVVLAVLLPALAISLIHGINLMLICVLPKRFAESGHVSFISGLLNFFTYIGSALSTYGIAKISELAGWQVTIWSWAAVAAVGLVFCVMVVPKFKGKKSEALTI